ncbi:von Willebrand factor A domain-containing protein 7 [Chanos chanos]|uniref:von Willebrand factor A domain-containing protein 7 n=1 Tax=Chanos chanos TaxID=29144 RepID=A0A6J2WH90_CHACN|nr:von Willebrand factor A domain-containing protein 7-like [Chanos chanos]
MPPTFATIVLALLLSGAQAFVPIGGGSSTHVTITGNAALKKITEVCRAVAEAEGREFNPTGSSAEELLRACLGTATGEVSAGKFRAALNEIYMQNGLVDRDFMTSNPHHFNSEAFAEGRNLITQGVASIKAGIREGNFQSARETLGRVCHTLQDFYSHSNWVELGNTAPYVNLIRPDLPVGNIADINTPTCSDCASGSCPNPLLPSIIAEKKLTSGYVGITSSSKPAGKCSHGGPSDLSSSQHPRGGISKDERRTDNAAFHNAAVSLATEATLELLEDIRGAAGNYDFLRLMGIARSAVLCFVIDTTGSMADDIAEAKRVAYNIIDSKKGTQDEPSEYILVPFNDPSFGPLIRTTDPEVMKSEISKLGAKGGGDTPEMCLSGLQLALTGAPPTSHIYVFTDAPAKDIDLERTIIALIRSTKSTVSFLLTSRGRRRRALEVIPRSAFRVYYDAALASGGQVIEVTKSSLPQATDIIVDTSTSALVTILQRARNPGQTESFPFFLDSSVSNVTIYITGNNLKFTLINPSGVTQSGTVLQGPLGSIQVVGNLWRIRLNSSNQTGMWQISMETTQAYTIKVTGQSAITFVYDFVEEFKGPHPGYASLSGQPQAGLPATLLLTVTGQKGPESLKVQEVHLVEVSGAHVSKGTIKEVGGGDLLVTVTEVPGGEFVVLLQGEDTTSSTLFQRQSTTQISRSKVTVKAVVDGTMLPGQQYKLPFTVTTNGTGGNYVIRARNDRSIPMDFPKSLSLGSGGSANGTITLTPPSNTLSGTDVTLTVEAEGPGSADSNYVVLRLLVVAKVTDFTPPVCEIVSVKANCSADCTLTTWDLSVNITDGNGTGIQDVSVQQGGGNFTMNTTEEGDVTVIQGAYTASCCSPDVTIAAVDKAGNVGKCFYSIRPPTTTTTATLVTTPSAGPPSLSLSVTLWICLLVSMLTTARDILSLSL